MASMAARRTSASASVLAIAINFFCALREPRCFNSDTAASLTADVRSSSADSSAREASGRFMRLSASTVAHRTAGEG
jgi:hypothetical protein